MELWGVNIIVQVQVTHFKNAHFVSATFVSAFLAVASMQQGYIILMLFYFPFFHMHLGLLLYV